MYVTDVQKENKNKFKNYIHSFKTKIMAQEKKAISVFVLEENITRAFAITQQQVNYAINNSKFSKGELAIKLGIDRNTFSTRFKNQTWTAKEFYELLNLLNKEFSNKFDKVKETKK